MSDLTECPNCNRLVSWPCDDCYSTDWEYEYKKLKSENEKMLTAIKEIASIGLRCPVKKCDAEEGIKLARQVLADIEEER